MQLTGELKEKVEKTETKEEARKVIEDAGMLLSDEELEQVSGGFYSAQDEVEAWNAGNSFQINQLIDELGLKCPPVV